MSRSLRAWLLLCELFERSSYSMTAAMPAKQRMLVKSLEDIRAVRTVALADSFALCPECHGQVATVVRHPADSAGLMCECPRCGLVDLYSDTQQATAVDVRWLAAQLQRAVGASAAEGWLRLDDDIWRLGHVQSTPVLLTRKVDTLWRNLPLLRRHRSPDDGRVMVIAPQPRALARDPFDASVIWLPMQESFRLQAGQVGRVDSFGPVVGEQGPHEQRSEAMPHGPFSHDFRCVHLAEWPHGPIHLRPAQSAVFEALWSFGGERRSAADVMKRAGLSSAKLMDVFKVPTAEKESLVRQGQLFAYRSLVLIERRNGLYSLPCAGQCRR